MDWRSLDEDCSRDYGVGGHNVVAEGEADGLGPLMDGGRSLAPPPCVGGGLQ